MAKKSRHVLLTVDSPGSPSEVLRRPSATAEELREALLVAVAEINYERNRADKYEGLSRKFFGQASERIRREESSLWTEREAFATMLEENDERVPAEHVLQRVRDWLSARMADKPLEVRQAEEPAEDMS